MIRPATSDDAARFAEIYNDYVTDTVITFEEEVVSVDEYAARIQAIVGSGLPWLVWESDGIVDGYAYAMPWRKRAAYRFTVESAIYIAKHQVGQGIGTQLYATLLNELQKGEYHSVMGLIALPNPASVKLHERFGFKKIGVSAEVGRKFDRWIDVGTWQLMLEE
jgi:L-amino acid N-acyltransferase YncA